MTVRTCLLVVLPPALILAGSLLLLAMPLPGSFPPPFSHGRNLPVAILAGVLGLGYLIALAVHGLSLYGSQTGSKRVKS